MSKCWYCNEELTTANYCDEHIGICTKCYTSMFKVGNDFVKGLTDKIADLEAKLAESESIRKGANEEIKKLHKRINEIVERDKNIVENLNQQLAEKDEAHMKAMENALNDFLTLRQELNQDKISFAITELKKAREIAYEDWLLDGCCNLTLARFLDKIDNQIEEIKKGKQDE